MLNNLYEYISTKPACLSVIAFSTDRFKNNTVNDAVFLMGQSNLPSGGVQSAD